MENSIAFIPAAVRAKLASRLLAFAFVAFLFVAFVGLQPFADPVRIDDLADTGEGNLTRQLIVISLALVVTWQAFFRRKSDLKTLPRLIPWPILLVLVWCATTLLWSPVPLIGFRRLGFTVLVIFTVFAAVKGLGPWWALRLLGFCLVGFVAASLISGPVVPNAVHLLDDGEAALVSAWRGIFVHKNHAGLAAALCVIAGLFLWRIERRSIWLLAMAGGAALLILAKSKTSLGLVLPAIFVGLYFEKYAAVRRGRILLSSLLLVCITVLAIVLIALNDRVSDVFDNPKAFTGRVTIWSTVGMMIAEHPIRGIGFGSIYHVGSETPLADYATGWVSFLAHGHNGYLDIIASTGVIGLALALFAFMVRPWQQMIQSKDIHPKLKGLLVAILSFNVFHNLLETSLLNGDRDLWISLLIVCAIAQAISHNR